jgi:uncharacterized membrane-anchored protein
MFTAVIAIPLLAYLAGLNPVTSFWFAYIVTRPVGASFADWLGFPRTVGGLGIGHGPVSLASALVFACFVAYLAVSRRDIPLAPARHAARPVPPPRNW